MDHAGPGQQKVWHMLGQKKAYIWGAGSQGRGLCRLLERRGFTPAGFLDSSPELQGSRLFGYDVLPPEELLQKEPGDDRPLILVTPFFFQNQIMERCREHGFLPGRDCFSYQELEAHNYSVDVSGACNLHCISCPRAAHSQRHPASGFMSAETFKRVLDKILREDPFLGSLQLYQWGEPLLNPELPQIIGICGQRGIPCAVSSNLNTKRNLAEVINAGPAWFRVSVSGMGSDYERTHTGGSWDKVSANLAELSRLRRELKPEMKTEVFYHLYRHNQGGQMEKVRELCAQLGFEFHPVWAYLLSLDDVLAHLEGGALSMQAAEAAGLLAMSLEDGMALARREADQGCLVERCININWNLSVSNCMMFFYPQDNQAAANFLETPLAQIQTARRKSALCRRCRAQSLHRYCSVYNTRSVQMAKGAA